MNIRNVRTKASKSSWSNSGELMVVGLPTLHEKVQRRSWLNTPLPIDELRSFSAFSLKALETFAPSLGTTMWQFFVWTFFISTTVLLHGTLFINSLAHVWGKRRFATEDDSRNNFFLALITLGEGWHNNHHRYPHSTRQGFLPHEIDPTYYILRILEKFRLVWDLRPVPEAVMQEARTNPSVPHER